MIISIGVTIALGALIIWVVHRALLKPPPAKKCGFPNGPAMTSPRVQLHDGRYLAYRELGVSKEEAQFKVIICHGLDSCKDMELHISQVLNYSSFLLLMARIFPSTCITPLKCIRSFDF